MMRSVFILFAVTVLILSCNQEQDAENGKDTAAKAQVFTSEESVKNTVVLYTTLLADGYRRLNMDGLLEVATAEHAEGVYHHMSAIGEGRVKMSTILKEQKFSGIRFPSPGKAEADTVEKWDYEYLSLDTGEQVYENSVTYTLSYKLALRNSGWFIENIVVVNAVERDPNKIPPFEEKRHGGALKEQ